MQVSVVDLRGQKRVSDLLEQESLVVVSHLTWVQGMDLQSSTRAVSILDCGTVFPVPCFCLHVICTYDFTYLHKIHK